MGAGKPAGGGWSDAAPALNILAYESAHFYAAAGYRFRCYDAQRQLVDRSYWDRDPALVVPRLLHLGRVPGCVLLGAGDQLPVAILLAGVLGKQPARHH